MVWPIVMCISWMRGVDARGHAEADVAERPHAAALGAREPNHGYAALAGNLDGFRIFGTVAARRDGQEHVARTCMGGQLARKHLVEPVVVADRGHGRPVGVQRDRSQGRPFLPEPSGQLRRDMLRVGRRAAVAGDEQLAASAKGGADGCSRRRDIRCNPEKKSSDLEVFVPDRLDGADIIMRHRRSHAHAPQSGSRGRRAPGRPVLPCGPSGRLSRTRTTWLGTSRSGRRRLSERLNTAAHPGKVSDKEYKVHQS